MVMAITFPLVSNLFIDRADAFADIVRLMNRTTRTYLPIGYDMNGSSIHYVINQKNTRSIGNVGIGDGRLRTMVYNNTLIPFMMPEKYWAGDIIFNCEEPVIIYKEPEEDIFNEFPIQPGTIYGRLLGLYMPGGGRVDMAIRGIGYEYTDPATLPAKVMKVSRILEAINNGSR
jgi:hypothetical protein